MEKVIPTAGVLIYRNNEEVLLVRHGESAGHLTDTYGLPAGRLRENESEIEAAIRELEEESGLITTQKHLRKLPKFYSAKIERKDGTKIFSLTVFLCDSYSGELRKTDETEPFWIKISDMDNYNLISNTKQIVLHGLE